MIGYIRHSAGGTVNPSEFFFLMQTGMFLTEADQLLHIEIKRIIFFPLAPVYPANRIVLTIGIIISFLRIIKFIPCQQTWRSLCCKEQHIGIFYLVFPQSDNVLFSARSFCTTVPAIIIIRPVLIAFSIFLIMLSIVGNQIP